MSGNTDGNSKNDKFREDILGLINSNLTAIRNPTTAELVLVDPDYEDNLRSEYLEDIEDKISEIEAILLELSPFVYSIRENIPDITSNNSVCAIYLLLCACIESLKATIILWRNGFYQEIMTINRKLEEAMIQCEVFIHDYNEHIATNFDKWFSGIIISHSTWREKIGILHKNASIDVESLENYIYRMESNISHNGYIWMLEMISPFSKDYDLIWSTRLYRTYWSLMHALGKLTHFNILLKGIYLYIFKDPKTFDEIDLILKRYNPDMDDPKISEKMKKDFPKK